MVRVVVEYTSVYTQALVESYGIWSSGVKESVSHGAVDPRQGLRSSSSNSAFGYPSSKYQNLN